MSPALHEAARAVDDSRAELACFARVVAEVWRSGQEPAASTRAELIAVVDRYKQLVAELDALLKENNSHAA